MVAWARWLEKLEMLWPQWCLPEIAPEIIKETQTDIPIVFYEVAALAVEIHNDHGKESSVCGIYR